MAESELPSTEHLHASAVQYLIDGNDDDAARVLLACTLNMEFYDGAWSGNDNRRGYRAHLTGPREAYERLHSESDVTTDKIVDALNAVLPPDAYVKGIVARVTLVRPSPGWREDLLDIARGKNVHNQGMTSDAVTAMTWQGLRFCSESERRIASALDLAGVMYMANCKARLGLPARRANRIPDFLVCYEGKWGILEVDGEPFHTASRAAEDHERDRLFKAHGIRVVEHFDATRCYEAPQAVVKKFLDILRQS